MGASDFILITRPKPESEEFARELQGAGFETLIEPMLSIQKQDFDVPNLQNYQGVIFTSANAVRIFSEASTEREIPLYVVGDNTAKVAQEFGYTNIRSAQGSAEDLEALVLSSITGDIRPYLHVRGEHAARPMDEELAVYDINVETLVVYEAMATQKLSRECENTLREGGISAVTFFSLRTAETFMKCVCEAKLENTLKATKALCISESVLKCVRPLEWSEAYAAQRPDREAMLALLRSLKNETSKKEAGVFKSMSTSENNKPIENAAQVIERFGGIRPMAKKIDVAVTTIQGWKKRDVIPATRREVILEAAATHSVDLSDLVQGAPPANQNDKEEAELDTDVQEEAPVMLTQAPEPEKEHAQDENDEDSLEQKLAAVEKKAITRSMWINVALVLIAVIAVAMLIWPQKASKDDDFDRLSALEERAAEIEGEMAEVKDQQSFFGTLIPEDLDQQLETLQEQAGQAKEQLGAVVEKAQEVSSDVLAEDAGTLEQRAQKLEEHLQEITGSPVLAGMLEKVQGMGAQPEGQRQLDITMSEISALIGGLGDQMTSEEPVFEETMNVARGESETLNQTFAGVPATDMKAAVMLLGMTQFRSSLNRDKEAFEHDLQVLMGLVGEDDVELRGALERLAPHAQEGVLTPAGLTDEFKGLAGDAVVASLSGEDVSIQERASARLNEVFQVEKDGELVSGTETQATVQEAEKRLNEGDIEGAIATVQNLQGPAALTMAPWLEQAQATLNAQKLKQILTQTINLKAYGGAGGITASGLGVQVPGSSEFIRDEESGMSVLKRSEGPWKPRKTQSP